MNIAMLEKEQFQYEYPRPGVTTDCVIFGFDNAELKVLLIERGIEPYQGKWALPGGFLDMEETADDCALRILKKETGLEHIFMEQLYTFSSIDRDPRYRVISIGYYALVKMTDFSPKIGTDTSAVKWFTLPEIPELAFDHQQIVDIAFERIKGKIKYQPIGFELLPERFTMPELHQLYEIILGTELDRRNFRKKMLSFDLLIDQNEYVKGAANRAPKIYSFDKERYEELSKKGFFFEL